MDCRKCGQEMNAIWEDVDITYGAIYTNYGCPHCGWETETEDLIDVSGAIDPDPDLDGTEF